MCIQGGKPRQELAMAEQHAKHEDEHKRWADEQDRSMHQRLDKGMRFPN